MQEGEALGHNLSKRLVRNLQDAGEKAATTQKEKPLGHDLSNGNLYRGSKMSEGRLSLYRGKAAWT